MKEQNYIKYKSGSKSVLYMAVIIAIAITALLYGTNNAKAACTAENDYKQGKVYTIGPKSKPLAESIYGRVGDYNKYTRAYFTIRSYMDKFEKAKKGTLIIKKGTYIITNPIRVPSNVTIIFEDGVKIVKGTKNNTSGTAVSKTIFQLIKPSKSAKSNVYGKHNGEQNIHFVGKGKVEIDLKYMSGAIAIVMGHNKNVTVDNILFKNFSNGHFIEMDACKNVSITNCSFKNAKKGSDYVKEAINIDTPDRATKGFNNDWSKHDKTPNENVLIENCKFSNMGRAIGTHKYSVKGGKQVYHDNITVRNCKITDMKWDAPIRIINWSNSRIENVIIDGVNPEGTDSSRGIMASGVKNISIKNNTFIGMNRPIQLFPWKNIGPGEEYPVTYNKLTEENLNDLKTNVGEDLGEYFVRISEEYNDFTYPDMIEFDIQ